MGRQHVRDGCLRFAALAVVSGVAAMGGWSLTVAGAVPAREETVARAAPPARGALAPAAVGRARVEIDARRAAQLPVLPVTLIDSGRSVETIAAPGTVARLLGTLGVALGPLDRIDRDLSEFVSPGAIYRIVRVGDREETLREALPREIRYLSDPDLEAGRQVVLAHGADGLALNTYLVRVVEGREIGRTLVASTVVDPSFTQVIAVGARPRPAPRAPREIETIIRAAADRYGADPEQLLRVAWCESRYDPSAYNPTHGDSGLFQFIPSTWTANSARLGYSGASAFDPVASANVAAWMFSRGSASLWTCR